MEEEKKDDEKLGIETDTPTLHAALEKTAPQSEPPVEEAAADCLSAEYPNEKALQDDSAVQKEFVKEDRHRRIRQVAGAFTAVGFMGFGGGSANIPIIEAQCVVRRQMADENLFTEQVVVSNITPGAFPVKMGQGIGCHHAGVSGGMLGALLSTLPGAVLTVILVSLLALVSGGFLTQFGYFSVGISVFIIFLMMKYVVKVVKDGKKNRSLAMTLGVLFVTFALTFGEKLRKLMDVAFGWNTVESLIVFKLSTVHMLILCFFIVFFTYGKLDKITTPICAAICLLYCFACGKNGWIPSWVQYLCYGLMILCVGTRIAVLKAKNRKKGIAKDAVTKSRIKIRWKPAIMTLALSLGVIAVLTGVCAAISPSHAMNALRYCGKGILSVLTTFGGGAAYYPVAENVFVDGGMIASDVFFSQMMPVANAMPGPVLVKLLASIGYSYANAFSGSMAVGYVYALLGIAIGVGMSASVFAVVYSIYHAFSDLAIFGQIKKWVLPVICGLLLTTTLSLLIEIFHNCGAASMPSWGAALTSAALYAAICFCVKKCKKIPEVVLIVLSGLFTLGLLNLVAWLV